MAAGQWVVAVTKPQREHWAAENIIRQGFECYLPLTLPDKPTIKTKAPKLQCLFPRYIFVHTPGQWRFLLGTFGVVNVVMQGNHPAALPIQTVEDLKAREDAQGIIHLPDTPTARFRAGDKVRINGGTFSGYTGIYSGSSASERVKVLLDFLGRQTPVLIAEDLLEIA